jgi:hypothetical protein
VCRHLGLRRQAIPGREPAREDRGVHETRDLKGRLSLVVPVDRTPASSMQDAFVIRRGQEGVV